MKQKIMSVNFDNVNMDEALNIAFKAAEDGRNAWSSLPTPRLPIWPKKTKSFSIL